jgi:thiol-disulfide isomerase/thioredoxin
MNRRRPKVARRLLSVVILGISWTAVPLAQSVSPFPVELVDVSTGNVASLTAGAPATHVVLLATWCPPCVDELAGLADLEERWGDRGYRLVLVAVRHRHDLERLIKFREQRRTPGQLLFDDSGKAQRAFDAEQLPAHLVFDSAGNELGRTNALDAGIAELIEGLLRSRDAAR